MESGLLPGADRDLVRPLERRAGDSAFAEIWSARESQPEVRGGRSTVELAGGARCEESSRSASTQCWSRSVAALTAQNLGLDAAGVELGRAGIRPAVDHRAARPLLTSWAIGDVAGEPMLAHKATYEAQVAGLRPSRAGGDVRRAKRFGVGSPIRKSLVGGDRIGGPRVPGGRKAVALFPWAAGRRRNYAGRDDGPHQLILEPTPSACLESESPPRGAGGVDAEGRAGGGNGAAGRPTCGEHPSAPDDVLRH